MQKIKPKKFLGVDYGMKRIGLALSDERKIIASPYMTLSAGRHLKDTANKFVQRSKKLKRKKTF
jgi:putative Holliday junction resolvase